MRDCKIPVLKVGCKAFLDSFLGLIEVKVNSIQGKKVTFTVTETFKAYKKGDIDTFPAWHVIPITAIRYGQFHPYILPYKVESCES